jgi:alkylated DNA nucleotide flippase Atl1
VDVLEASLGKILEGSNQYVIPLYQRPYSWQTRNWLKLWEDITDLAEARRTQPSASHFTGTLVLEASTVTAGLTQFVVVDGQQRLTTLSLLLAALISAWGSAGNELAAKRIREQYLVNTFAEPPDAFYRLRPANFDERVYRDVVDGRNPHSGGSKIDNAYTFFLRKLQKLPESGPTLKEIEDATLSGLKFVAITAKSEDNVYRIFESINNTGIGLTQADLVRNLLFMRLGSQGAKIYDSLWLPLVAELNPMDVETVFWIDAQWRDPDTRKLDVYEAQKKHISSLRDDELVPYIENVVHIATALRQLRGLAAIEHAELQRRVGRFSQLRIPGALVLATRILYLLGSGKAPRDQSIGAFAVLESYLVRRSIMALPVNSIGRICAAAAFDLNDDTEKTLHRRLSTGRRQYVTDREIVAAIKESPLYVRGRRGSLKCILQWLLERDQNRDTVNFDPMSIEHVLPQKLSPEAAAEFDLTLEPEEDRESVHEALVHTLGNLTLTNYNSELSNSPFSIKRKEKLKDTSVISNHQIAAETQWGPDEIRARSSRLAAAAVAEWQGPDESLLERDTSSIFDQIGEVVETVGPGHWTTYGDIAKTVGTVGQVVGMALAHDDAPDGAWRVLRAGGLISPEFRWPEKSPHRGHSCQKVLENEGVNFLNTRADPAQRLTAEDLRERLGESEEGNESQEFRDGESV